MNDDTSGPAMAIEPTDRDSAEASLLKMLGEMEAECLHGAYNLDPKDKDRDGLDHAVYTYRATLWKLEDGYWRHPDMRWFKYEGGDVWKGDDGVPYSGDHPSRFVVASPSRRMARR